MLLLQQQCQPAHQQGLGAICGRLAVLQQGLQLLQPQPTKDCDILVAALLPALAARPASPLGTAAAAAAAASLPAVLQTGLAGVSHIGSGKDFGPLIKAALAEEGFHDGNMPVRPGGTHDPLQCHTVSIGVCAHVRVAVCVWWLCVHVWLCVAVFVCVCV